MAVDEGWRLQDVEDGRKLAIFLVFDMNVQGNEVLDRMESSVKERVRGQSLGILAARAEAGGEGLERALEFASDSGTLAGGGRFQR